jgi:hypothetical protein
MLYQIVTGEIREGDVSRWIDKTLTPVNPFWIGKNASDVEVIVFRPVKVPSEEELDKAVPCAKTMTCPPNMPINTTCIKCHRETMLRLMGLEPEQAKE